MQFRMNTKYSDTFFVKLKVTLGLNFSYKRNKHFTTPENKKVLCTLKTH